jgi:PAS domain S-box-containing protein
MAVERHALARLPLGETRERLLARIAFEATWERDLDSQAMRWGDSVESIFGYDRAEVVNHLSWWRERVHPEDLERAEQAAVEAVRSGGWVWSNEYRFRRKDGSWAWVTARGGIERDGEGRAVREVGAMIDISALKETEARLRLFTDQIPARATATDRELRVVWDVGAGFPGSPSAVGKTVPELFADSPDRERVLEGCRKALAGESCKLQIDNGEAAAQLQLGPVRDLAGNVIGVTGVAFDVTDRVRSEEEVRASQRLLQRVLDTIPVGVVVVDRAGDLLLSNPAASRIWGGLIASGPERWAKSKGHWHGSGQQIGPGEWASERALTRGETSLGELIDIETFDGRRRTIENAAAPIRDTHGSIVGAVVVNEDVTERKRAEEEVARRVRQQAAVAQLTLSALRGDELQPLFDEAAALVASTLQIDRAMLLESVPDRSELVFRSIAGSWMPDILPRITIRTEPGMMSWFSLRAKAPLVVEDLAAETRFVPCDVLRAQGVTSGINVPIPGQERPFGILGAHSTRQRAFTEDEVSFVWSVSNVLATSIEQRRAAGELREKREQLHALSSKLLQAQEAERRAVARELHDDFGQVLTAIRLNLMRKERDEAETISLVDGAIARMRDLAHDLRPPMLDELGLAASLRWYVEREARRAGLEFHFAIAPPELRPPPGVETTCFRVAQEAFTNVIRHAQARRVDVELRVAGDALELVVHDDGRGFDVDGARRRAARGKSQGLLSMQERVALAGGKLEIDSAPGQGTAVRARLPLGSAR